MFVSENKIRRIAGEVVEPVKNAGEEHAIDCVAYRKDTKKELKQIKNILSEAKDDRVSQHQQNVKSLVWQRGLLITILLAIFGYLGSQVFNGLFVPHPPVDGNGAIATTIPKHK